MVDLYEKQGLQRIIKYIKQSRKPVIIFGAGSYGQAVYCMLRHKGAINNVKAFCDNSAQKRGEIIYGLEVLDYETVKIYFPDCIFIIASTYYIEIEDQLKGLCETNFYTIYPQQIEYSKEWYEIMDRGRIKILKDWSSINSTEFERNRSKLEGLLADQESKDVLKNIIAFRNTGDYGYINSIYNPNEIQYFDDSIIELSDDEYFIDLGAWDGDTVCNFIKVTNNRYRHIVSFEPGEQQFKALNSMIRSRQLTNIDTYKIGAWSESAYLTFEENEDSSKINNEGSTKIKVNAMDNMFLEQPVSFIKMDIEGAEKEALMGAKKIIHKYKPKLAVCVYHKPEDIVRLPLLINEILPEYKIFLRHHTEFHTETVCYAIC